MIATSYNLTNEIYDREFKNLEPDFNQTYEFGISVKAFHNGSRSIFILYIEDNIVEGYVTNHKNDTDSDFVNIIKDWNVKYGALLSDEGDMLYYLMKNDMNKNIDISDYVVNEWKYNTSDTVILEEIKNKLGTVQLLKKDNIWCVYTKDKCLISEDENIAKGYFNEQRMIYDWDAKIIVDEIEPPF